MSARLQWGAPTLRNSSGLPQGNGLFKPVRIVAGGFCTGISGSLDDVTIATRIDVGGAYIKTGSNPLWQHAFTNTSLAVGDCPGTAGYVAPTGGLTDGNGCFEIVVAPNNNQIIYAVWNARTWKSTNAGGSWTHQTGVPDILAQANSGPQPHNCGPNMAVDPQNASVCLLGTQNNGLYYTTNGGTTWTNAALGTNGSLNGYQLPSKVACDPTSTVTGGVHQRWLGVLQGTGIQISTTGPGGPYSAMTSGPLWVSDLVYDSLGNAWALDVSNTTTCNLWKCAAGGTTWVNMSTNSAPHIADQGVQICPDPLTSGRIIILSDQGYSYYTTNSGTSWSGAFQPGGTLNSFPYSAPWLAQGLNLLSFGIGGCYFSATTQGLMRVSNGVGTYHCSCTSGNTFNWIEDSAGIENCVANVITEVLGGNPLFGVWDQGCWNMANLDSSWRGYAYRAPAGAFANGVQACWDVACAADNRNWVVALINFTGQHTAYSTDGWNTCQSFPTSPPIDGIGGCLAVGNAGTVVVCQSNNQRPYYTKDGGNTWNYIPSLVNPSAATFGSGNAELTFVSSAPYAGTLYTVVINAASGAGSVSVAGSTITVTPASTGTTATAVAAQMNAYGPCAALITTTAGGTGAGTVGTTAGVTTAFESGFSFAYYFNKRIATYDALAGKFYVLNYGTTTVPNSLSGNMEGIWSASDPSAAWTHVFTGSITGSDFYHAKLKWVPGNQGHFFFCAGGDQASPFKRSTDGGVSWQNPSAATITNVADFGFGAAAPGQTYPSVYFWGTVNSVVGLYRSDDNFATTPKFLTAFPGGFAGDAVTSINGSINKYGRVYVGYAGHSFVYGDYSCPFTVS